MIFVSNSKRCVNIETARNIVNEIRKFREEPNDNPIDWSEANALQRREGHNDSEWYTQWSAILNKNIKRKPPLVVGVFMNQTKEEILQIVKETKIDLIQLHGNEGFELCDRNHMNGIPCIRVLHITANNQKDKNDEDKEEKNELKELKGGEGHDDEKAMEVSMSTVKELIGCDVPNGPPCALLLDTKLKGKSSSGGTGVVFDWKVAKNMKINFGYPLIVAGGLNVNNVKEAVRETGAWCVDVSSGVENVETGFKDHEKVKLFISNAKK